MPSAHASARIRRGILPMSRAYERSGRSFLARAAFLGHDNTIARDLALRAANAPMIPAVQRAIALSEAGVYTLLSDPPAAAQTIAEARAAIGKARPVDAADAVALASADDILAFLAAANGEPYESALARFTRDGHRFEARLARAYAARFIRAKAPERIAAAAPTLDLTPREREILAHLVDGLTNKEIAQRLMLGPRTVETHVERVLGKLQVGSRSRAIAMALRLRIVELEPA